MKFQKEGERENGAETTFEEIMVENFPELMKQTNPLIQKPNERFPQEIRFSKNQALSKPRILLCKFSFQDKV